MVHFLSSPHVQDRFVLNLSSTGLPKVETETEHAVNPVGVHPEEMIRDEWAITCYTCFALFKPCCIDRNTFIYMWKCGLWVPFDIHDCTSML